ncbi:MAG: hypothetical protein ACMG6E_07125 [Candidatus Roizmanbacteria bacterium]
MEYYNKALMGFDSHPAKKDDYKSSSSKPKQHESITACLEAYRKKGKLDKENAWYCNVCKDHVEATKQIELYNAPPILIFCFQRFKSHGMYFKEKMEDIVDFPIENLDMTPFVVSEEQKQHHSPLLYDLYAVSNHYGSLAFGHYTAYCKNNGTWYDFNDSSVSECSNPD